MHRLRPLALACLASVTGSAFAAWAVRTDLGEVVHYPQAYWTSLLVIGAFGEGSVTIDGGTQASEDSVALGGLGGSSGTLTVQDPGSKLTTTGDPTTRASAVTVGAGGAGIVLIQDGAVLDVDGTATQPGDLGAGFALGLYAGSSGHATVSGAGSMLLVRNGDAEGAGIAVGLAGSGSLDVADGGVVSLDTGSGANSGMTIGNDAGSDGAVSVSGAGSRLDLAGDGTAITLANAGTGSLVLDAGAAASAQVMLLGLAATGAGTLAVRSGAELRLEGTNPFLGYGGSLAVGMAGTGEVRVEGGSLVLDDADGILHGIQVGGTVGCGGPCPFTGGTGSIVVDGPDGTVLVFGDMAGVSIGADGDGSLTLNGGALVLLNPDGAAGMSVGLSPGSHGRC